MPVSVRSSTLYNPIIPLKTTFADCENTTSEIDIVTVTIPANTLGAGDIIIIDFTLSRLQNSGSLSAFASKIMFNSSTVFFHSITDGGIPTSSTIFRLKQQINFHILSVVSNTATILHPLQIGYTGGVPNTIVPASIGYAIAATTASNGVIFDQTGTMDVTQSNQIRISHRWQTASSTRYIRMRQAQAYIIKKAV
jgi:hypothetical protein